MSLRVPTPIAPVAWPYGKRVSVSRNKRAMYGWLLSLNGWTFGTDLRVIAEGILRTFDASPAGARIVASTATVVWLEVEPD